MALNTVSTNRLSTNVKTSNLGTELSKKIGQNKNLIINGAMQVAQRGTSSTSDGYLIDRFNVFDGASLDEACTREQVNVASGTTPYTLGFRKALKLTNGNQTSGAEANDNIQIINKLESQDIANSGWNYTSASSFITLQFWVKSSVAQNFFGYLRTHDGTGQRYAFETGSLSADTWTKITKTIPGNSNLQFDNDANVGLEINIAPFWGTTYTDSGVSLNAWAAYATGTRTPVSTTTWYTTNDATFEITGVQLEVGSVATDFEHRSLTDELMRCYRYYQLVALGSEGTSGTNVPIISGAMYGTTTFYGVYDLKTRMRATPTMESVSGTDYYKVYRGGSNDNCDDISVNNLSPMQCTIRLSGNLSGTSGDAGWSRTNHASAFAAFTAEI